MKCQKCGSEMINTTLYPDGSGIEFMVCILCKYKCDVENKTKR